MKSITLMASLSKKDEDFVRICDSILVLLQDQLRASKRQQTDFGWAKN
jgi:hypothetical protein